MDTIVSLSSSKTTVLCSYEERELGNKEALQSQFFKVSYLGQEMPAWQAIKNSDLVMKKVHAMHKILNEAGIF